MASVFSPSVVAGLVTAAATLTFGALPSAADAQVSTRFDGYCYVRSSDMQRHTTTDTSGVRRSSARCYKGEYYAYSGAYFAAPRAPDGYQVAYYTTRPDSGMYDEVYDASGLPYGSDDYAQSNDDGSNSYAMNDDSRYAGGAQDYSQQGTYSQGSYDQSDYGRTSDDRDTYAQGSTGYGRDSYTPAQGGYAYSDDRSSGSDSYSAPAYGDHDTYNDDRHSQSGQAYGDSYANDPYPNTGYTGGYASNTYSGNTYSGNTYSGDRYGSHAVQGWRDDQGQWHLGRPRAVGWEDDSGHWHQGEVTAYGWRDGRGSWHETQDGTDSQYNGG